MSKNNSDKINKTFYSFIRSIFLIKQRKKLINKNLSLIASNCNGSYILHELKLQFNSPFVNLWIKPGDFIKLLSNLKIYMNYNLTFIKEKGITFPIGLLGDIKIYFQHFKTENEAILKWNERKNRINYENLFILFTDRDGCTNEDLLAFDKLPYKNKVVFVHKERNDIKSAVYIKGFENNDSVGICSDYRQHSFKRYYDDFDYVKWFNGNLLTKSEHY